MFIRLTILLAILALAFAQQDTCASKPSGFINTDSILPIPRPFVNGSQVLYRGTLQQWHGEFTTVSSPIMDQDTGTRTIIGSLPKMTAQDALDSLSVARTAWSNGQGEWPQMKLADRIAAIRNIVNSLQESRDDIISILMWEICKNREDAATEFDRTMQFIEATIQAFIELDKTEGAWRTVSGIAARVRRTAIGIMLCLGPFNYPFNETYATLIPALLAGNIVIMKIPSIGGLAHLLTIEAFEKHLPRGVMSFISGSGRETMSPLMSTGHIDVLAFIGGSKAADALIKAHPAPHRLKTFLQLEGKNLGIILSDADLDVAADQVTLGSTTFNGQRCTAIKLVMVHRSVADAFMNKLTSRINSLPGGLPWESGVKITPLPEPDKVSYLQGIIADAQSLGAQVVNSDCGGGSHSGALMTPAIVYPVDSRMRLWREEQFGPVIPVAVFDQVSEIDEYLSRSSYGQQASLFTSNRDNHRESEHLIDILSTSVGRININTQCGRSPDVFPFSGRRSSALGTMSVTQAIKEFSIETVLAAKKNHENDEIVKALEQSTNFLAEL